VHAAQSKSDGTFDLERELDLREPGVEAGRRLIASRGGEQMQRVAREIAGERGADDERAREVVDAVDQLGVGAWRQRVGRRSPLDRHGRDARAAVDADVVGREREAGSQQPHEERPLAQLLDRLEQVAHLEELDRVGAAELAQHLEPAHVAADLPHDPPPPGGTAKPACCTLPSSRTR
jgi:hypothetical protein